MERGEDRSEGVGWDGSVGICRRSDGGSAASFEKSGSAKIAGEGVEESGVERFTKDAEIRNIDFILDRVRVGDTGIELGQLKGLASRRRHRCDLTRERQQSHRESTRWGPKVGIRAREERPDCAQRQS